MSPAKYKQTTSLMGGLHNAARIANARREYTKRDEACRRYDELALQLIQKRSTV